MLMYADDVKQYKTVHAEGGQCSYTFEDTDMTSDLGVIFNRKARLTYFIHYQ